MAKILLYTLPPTNDRSFALKGEIGPEVEKGSFAVTKIELSGSFQSTGEVVSKSFLLDERVELGGILIPKDLLVPEGEDFRFLNQGELEGLARHKIEALDQMRRDLRARLVEPITIVHDSEVFGITSFAAVTLRVAPRIIDPDPGFAPDSVIFSLAASFDIESTLNLDSGSGGPPLTIAGHACFGFEITHGDLSDLTNLFKKALGRLEFDLPKFPGFDLKLPKFKLPKLDLDGIDLIPDLDLGEWPNFLPFSLPLPKIGSIGIEPVWSKKPAFKLSNDGGALALGQTVDGELQLNLTTTGTTLLALGMKNLVLAADKFSADLGVKVTPETIVLEEIKAIKFLGLQVDVGASALALELSNSELTLTHSITATQGRGIVISDAEDPAIALHLDLEVQYKAKIDAPGEIHTKVKKFGIREPYPLALVNNLEEQAGKLLRLIGKIPLPGAPGPLPAGLTAVLRRIMELIRTASRSLAGQFAKVGNALAGAGEAIGEAIQKLFEEVTTGATGFPALAFELRLDPKTYRPVQLMIMPAGDPLNLSYKADFLGFHLEVDGGMRPALVIDREHDWFGMALLPSQVNGGGNPPGVMLESDLWLSRGDGPTQPLGVMGEEGKDAPPKLVKLAAKVIPDAAGGYPMLVLAAIERGKLRLFRTMENAATGEKLKLTSDAAQYAVTLGTSGLLIPPEVAFDGESTAGKAFGITFELDAAKIKERALSILPKADGNAAGGLSQKIEVKEVITTLKDWKAEIKFKVIVHLDGGFNPEADLIAQLDLESLDARITGGSKIAIRTIGTKTYEPLGLLLEIEPKTPPVISPENKDGSWKIFELDLSRGAERFALSDDAKASLTYKKVSTSGRGLVFELETFAASRSGFDLAGKILPEPVTLGGVDVPFRFTSGQIAIVGSKFNSASLMGSGQLPPALMGEANASIAMHLGQDQNQRVAVLGATARLDKSKDPIRCNATMFEFTITELGFDFINDGAYHFYFLLTGSAAFRPSGGAFASGLLSRLKEIEIKLEKAPLGGKSQTLLRSLSFLVKVDPPARTNVFELFEFQLRGVGLLMSSEAFNGDPALVISGQVKFAEFGDVISPRFDFHKMYIAGPKKGGILPRVRFDGLTVGLKAGAIDVEGTAIAVDDSLPSLYAPNTLPADVTAKGFLASAKLGISGWGKMSGALGFLELRKQDGSAPPRHSFFIYGQLEEQTVPINTPVGRIVLREYGFGLGYRFTLAGIAQAERAASPRELVKILDEISKYQGSLDRFEAWHPTYDNSDLTLALRGMFSIASGSPDNGKYNPKGEKDLPNPLLFDIVAALRTDLTFLIKLRAWIATNYHDWTSSPGGEAFKSNPTLRGYLYFSVPRKEFLARMVASIGGHVGDHPQLPGPLKKALQSVAYSSTLYIRPGLFHMEYGWPYELGFSVGEPAGPFFLKLRGGLINRIEDFSLLYGMAFRADGHVKFGGTIGGSSFGASAYAEATFSLQAKIIAYLSLKRFGDSIFYGMLRFDTTLSVRVEVWISFRIFRKRIRLSIGFSLSLAISIGLEAVISPSGLGGRAHVAVGVRGFGRTLSVGINLSFNDGLLNRARAQVARFESLGLAAEIPPEEEDGRRAERIPNPDTPRREAQKIGDSKINNDLATIPAPPKKTDQDNPLDHDLDDLIFDPDSAADIHPTDFWAMLFPIQGESDQYIMVLTPRDHTDKVLDNRSAFYASPEVVAGGEGKDDTYTASHTLIGDDVVLDLLKGLDGNTAPRTIMVKTDTTITSEESTEDKISLGHLLLTMFLRLKVNQEQEDGSVKAEVETREPRPRRLDPKIQALPQDPQAAAEKLGQIGRSRVHLSPLDRLEAEIEEARSSFISAICESAHLLAENLLRKEATVDARHIGLVFKVSDADIKELFDPEDRTNPNPRSARFKIRKSDVSGAGDVALFNPPERMFRKAQPGFVPIATLTADGIKMDWDLEPAWRASEKNLYDDPESHLKHYRIRRRIVGPGLQNDYRAEFVVKAAAPIEFLGKDDSRSCQMIRPPYQFTDDLRHADSDGGSSRPIPEELRQAILGLAPGTGYKPATIVVKYEIVPVDIAGTSDYGQPLDVPAAPEVNPPAISPAEATLQLVYNALPTLVGAAHGAPAVNQPPAFKYPGMRLLLRKAVLPPMRANARARTAQGEKTATPPSAPPFDYHLRIHRDRARPSGAYGADAVTQGRSRLGQEQIDALEGTDVVDFFLILSADLGDAEPDPQSRDLPVSIEIPERDGAVTRHEAKIYRFDPKKGNRRIVNTDALSEELHSACYGFDKEDTTLSPAPGRSSWLYLRRLSKEHPEDKKLHGEWRSVPVNIAVLGNTVLGKKNPLPVNSIVETFEQPVALAFQAITREDMKISSGRLHVFQPGSQSTLADFVKKPKTAITSSPDPARRTATRLTWNARPCSLRIKVGAASYGKADADLFRWIGGFDVYRLNPDTLPGEAQQGELPDIWARAAEPVGSLSLLPVAERGLSPSGFGDMSRLEMSFPSQAWREGQDPATHAAAGEQQLAPASTHAVPPWFSAAESSVIFPRPRLRRSLFAELEEGMVAELFAEGAPKAVVVEVKGIAALDGALNGWYLATRKKNDSVTRFTDWSVKLEGGDRFLLEDLREKLRTLVILPKPDVETSPKPNPGNRQVALESEEKLLARKATPELEFNPQTKTDEDPLLAAVSKLSVELRAYRDPSDLEPMARVEQPLELLPDLHPILLDTLARVTLFCPEESSTFYRRYAIVADDQAPNTAGSLSRFAEELPAERDPHGFSALRSLGLASGFQLYDVDTRRFLRWRQLFEQINVAFTETLALYRIHEPDCKILDEGLPFVDILTMPWGNSSFHWFDGGAGAVEANDASKLRDEETLAVVQISLRPAPDRLMPPDSHRDFAPRVRYAALFLLKDDLPKKEIRHDGRPYRLDRFEVSLRSPATPGLIVDLMAPGYGLETIPQIRLTDSKENPVAIISTPPDIPTSKDDVVLAQLRIAAFDLASELKSADLLVKPVYVGRDAKDQKHELRPREIHSTEVVYSYFDSGMPGTFEAGLGRFAPISAEDWGKVLYDFADSGSSEFKTLLRLEGYGKRHFGRFLSENLNPTDPDSRTAVGSILTTFWQRFLDHTAIPDPNWVRSENYIHFSLGTVADPGTWQQAPDSKGQVSIVIPDPDRRGSRRAFAVRPTGRYDAWARATDLHMHLDPSGAPVVGPAVQPQGLEGALNPGADLLQFIHCTLPRFDPLEKPVILAARRRLAGADERDKRDDTKENQNAEIDPGDGRGHFEVVVAHPSDMVLAAANQNNVAKLAPQELSMGLRRSFPYQIWLLQAAKAAGLSDLNPMAPIGSKAYVLDSDTQLEPFDRSAAALRLEVLRKSVPDAWLGTTAFSFSRTPYFYDIEARVTFAAGNVVSEPASVTFTEGFPKLHLPFHENGCTDTGYPGRAFADPPLWSVRAIQEGEKDEKRYLHFILPLLRFIDAMTKEDAELWFGTNFEHGSGIKSTVHLPEPKTSYRLALETLADPTNTTCTRRTEARTFEIDIAPQVATANKDDTVEMYMARVTGQMLKLPAANQAKSQTPLHHDHIWWLELDTEIAPSPLDLNLGANGAADLQKQVDSLSRAAFEFAYDISLQFGANAPATDELWTAALQALSDELATKGLTDQAAAIEDAFTHRPADITTARLDLRMPAAFWDDAGKPSPAATAFFGQEILPLRPVLRMHKPPLPAEKAIVIPALAQPNNNSAQFDRLLSDWLFGPSRRPAMLAMHGTLPPISAIIHPAAP